ncbi:putative E3 ubiquitin-protein ligase UBR7 [Lamellibrachia satsuma]|nr:putative E3 ubiquitin-protein ligase UBR7 [Lamellibrachia satsuma]
MADDSSGREVARENEDEDSGLSMLEVLEEENQLEEDAIAVLGDSDDKNCTYLMGYVPRQALYACDTCTGPAEMPAGICLACSYECHEGHQLHELYTKRNMRCDCGNSKFPNLTCKLCPDKVPENADNRYNQNFLGTYCTCHRPYPDPDDQVEDEMIQCVVCEDWFHGRHLGTSLPPSDDYAEMVCGSCMKKNPFLQAYAADTISLSHEIDVGQAETVSCDDVHSEPTAKTPRLDPDSSKEPQAGSSQGSPTPREAVMPCRLKELTEGGVGTHEKTMFWPEHWRTKLCACSKCQEMYNKSQVTFLLDEDDSIRAYEDRGKARTSGTQYESGMRVLSNMDRVQQVEVLTEYNDLKSELSQYLKKFADNKKVVREEDIREFFTDLAARKKKKTSSNVQYFCK